MSLKAIVPMVMVVLFTALPVMAGQTYLLVSGYDSDNVVRFDGATGAFVDQYVPAGSGGLDQPEGLIFRPDQGALYVVSAGTNSVKKFNAWTGAYVSNFASGGGASYPRGAAFGPDGNLYVCSDKTNQTLRYNGTTGAFMNVFASTGSQGVLFFHDEYMYVSNYNVVDRYNATTGAFVDHFASGHGLNVPQGMTFGPDGNLYIANSNSNNVLRFNGTTGAFIDTFVSSGSGGLNGSEDVLFGPDGNLYVDGYYSGKVCRYNGTTGEFMDVFASNASLNGPTYMEFVEVPEPATLALLVLGALAVVRKRCGRISRSAE